MPWDTKIFNFYNTLINITKTLGQQNFPIRRLDDTFMRATLLPKTSRRGCGTGMDAGLVRGMGEAFGPVLRGAKCRLSHEIRGRADAKINSGAGSR
jgi:hypothetical protein